eukprot:7385167-Prymnesium_polylepis.1
MRGAVGAPVCGMCVCAWCCSTRTRWCVCVSHAPNLGALPSQRAFSRCGVLGSVCRDLGALGVRSDSNTVTVGHGAGRAAVSAVDVVQPSPRCRSLHARECDYLARVIFSVTIYTPICSFPRAR